MSTGGISDAQKIEILYNKSFGVATSLPSAQLTQLPSANANIKIIPDLQIYSQKIPATAPSDMIDVSWNQVIDPSGALLKGKKSYSSTYPWIVKYENFQLTELQYRRGYSGKINNVGVNFLSQTIPFNYDPVGSYEITVNAFKGVVPGNFPQDSTTLPWYYDKDAGFITFYGSDADRNTYLLKPPLMTFWRYEGEFGLGNGSGSMGVTGPTGVAGPAGGPTGPMGATGADGPTGYTGVAGPTGADGAIGVTGYTGADGPTGYTGAAGYTGADGAVGVTGSPGPTGYTGAAGYTGADGAVGVTGYTGADGPTGYTGAAGYTGADGAIGVTGYTGADGPTGYTGAAGYTGADGAVGVTGYTGADGPTGYTGAAGYTGADGAVGVTGYTGADGPTGAAGYTGADGAVGVTGYTGADGPTGYTGAAGYTGADGAVGVTGYTGADGPTGYTGYTGADGAVGVTGYTGADGPTGYTGAAGYTGADGAVGVTGYTGADGPTGYTGYTGADGAVGVTGYTGADGPTGYTGAVGADGAVGVTGYTGADGPTGYTGAAGADGYTGSAGPTGYTGTAGATGSAGPTGPGSVGTYANDMWLLTYLLGQPPAITFGTPLRTSDYIYIPWSYPQQYQVGWAENLWLPYISKFFASITTSVGGEYNNVVTDPSASQWIKAPTGSVHAILIAIKKTPDYNETTLGNGAGQFVIIEDSSVGLPSQLCYLYYNSSLSEDLMTAGSTGTLTGYYGNPSNIGATSNRSTVLFDSFLAGATGPTGPPEPTALTSILLDPNSYAANSATIYRIFGPTGIGSVPLIKETQVATLPFNAPIHRKANRGAAGTSRLMTLSATLNGATGPSVNYSGFPATTPSASPSTGGMTITPNSVTDYYAGDQPGYYLTSSNTITAVGLSAGSDVNILTATQTFSTGTTGASASATFYYDPITSPPACSINELSISSSTKVSGISIYIPPTDGSTPSITIDASASNMGNYFYRSPLITYNYAVNGTAMGPTGESGLSAVAPGDISGNMFKTGTLHFSSTVPVMTDMTRIDISANAYNIFGTSETIGRSFNIITDASSVKFVTQTLPSSIPELVPLASPVVGFRIWSAPSVMSPYDSPDLSYNGVLYYNSPYDNSWDITAPNASTELLIKNGLFTTPNAGGYSNYSGFAWNSTINYSSIPSTGLRFASFCWKLPITTKSTTNLTFTINSINIAALSNNRLTIDGLSIPIFYCFQEAENPSAYGIDVTTAVITYYNTVWLNANLAGIDPVTSYQAVPSTTSNAGRFGTLYGGVDSSHPITLSGSTGNFTATIPAFIPAWPVQRTTYLYARIALPMTNAAQFGAVSAAITISTQ
jgi:hypothetical protein